MNADETKTLAWRCIIETQGIEKNTRQAANSLSTMERATQSLSKGLKGLGVVAIAAGVAKLAWEAIKVADAYTAMANTLKQSTNSAAELQAVQVQLIEQANQTSSTVELATESFNKLHDATEGLGLSQQEVLDLSKTLADTMRLSGLNAAQASAGIAQFANTLEDGGMNLKEFKQAFKETPELIKALQVGLGKTKDELRLMAEQGDLTTEMMVEGLAKAAEEVRRRAAEMGPTVADSFKSAASSFGAMIGEFNEGLGVTKAIAGALKGTGDFFKDIASNAQLMGIAVKFALKTVEIEIATFIDMTIENIIRLGISFNRALNDIMTGGRLFGEGFNAAIDKQQADSDERMRKIIERRKQFIAEFTAATDAQAAALNGANLDTKGDKSPRGPTDEQIKITQGFNDALAQLKTRASDAAKELQALKIEMTSGKPAADAFRAQLQAAAAGAELRKQMTEQFKKGKMGELSTGDLDRINKAVEEFAKNSAEVKLTSAAWSTLGSAMNGAMSEGARAEKETRELTAAFEQLNSVIKPTAEQIAQFERAKTQIAERGRATEQSLADTLSDMRDRLKASKNDMKELSIEIFKGADAAAAFREEVTALTMQEELIKQFTKAFEKSGGNLTKEKAAEIRDLAKSVTELQTAADRARGAYELLNNAFAGDVSHAERARMEIDELNRAMIELDKQGLLTDDMIARFDQLVMHIADGADVVQQTWKAAVGTILDNLVDFLADGEFNFKQFVQTTVKQLGRLVIQLMLVKSLQNTAFGNWLGIANGAAFSHGRMVPMASGGIVSKPTIFPMANGSTGLMGEAGPEAVMPLARLSSGKLGVGAQPANIQVINNTGVQARARIERSENRTSIILEAAQLGAQLAEDRMTRSMRSGYGTTSTALQSTYGLRRRG
jgi:tape measure domain-containing protein